VHAHLAECAGCCPVAWIIIAYGCPRCFTISC
jgi:hypothetical protein